MVVKVARDATALCFLDVEQSAGQQAVARLGMTELIPRALNAAEALEQPLDFSLRPVRCEIGVGSHEVRILADCSTDHDEGMRRDQPPDDLGSKSFTVVDAECRDPLVGQEGVELGL